MCLGGRDETPHSCFNDCPLCWSFAQDTLTEEGVSLGTFDHLSKVAEAGCWLCQYVRREAIANKPVPWQDILLDTQVSMFPQFKRHGSRVIESIVFRFSANNPTPWPAGIHIGLDDWEVRVGIYSMDSQGEKLFQRKPADPCIWRKSIFDSIQECIGNCLNNHPRCRRTMEANLPRRILHIDANTGDIHLHISQGKEIGSYGVLSYCWGQSDPVKLTTSNLHNFTAGAFNVNDLPQTIKDALRITHWLNLSYLWVDSLCILQDDDDDKTEMIADMSKIYQGAAITISAASARDCSEGFLHDREMIQNDLDWSRIPLRSRFQWPMDEQGDIEPLAWLNVCHSSLGYRITDFSSEAINTRAWTFQEAWLSNRLLIFGSRFPQWRCLTESKSFSPEPLKVEDYETESTSRGRSMLLSPAHVLEGNDEVYGRSALLETWNLELQRYCSRSIMYREDRLYALSGLADEYNRLLQDEYLSGLWRSSLPISLLWRRVDSGPEQQTKTPKPQALRMARLSWMLSPQQEPQYMPEPSHHYYAPSWSPLRIFADFVFESGHHHTSIDTHDSLITIHKAVSLPKSQLVPNGEILMSYLELTGPMCCMTWSELTARFVFASSTIHVYWDYIVVDKPSEVAIICKEHPPAYNDQEDIERAVTVLGWRPEDDPSLQLLKNLAPRKMPSIPDEHDRLPDFGTDPVVAESTTFAEDNKLQFWFLEVTHSHAPSGLLLKRTGWNVFVRLGYFYMGRSLCPDINPITQKPDVGTRNWDWDSMLRMRNIFLI